LLQHSLFESAGLSIKVSRLSKGGEDELRGALVSMAAELDSSYSNRAAQALFGCSIFSDLFKFDMGVWYDAPPFLRDLADRKDVVDYIVQNKGVMSRLLTLAVEAGDEIDVFRASAAKALISLRGKDGSGDAISPFRAALLNDMIGCVSAVPDPLPVRFSGSTDESGCAVEISLMDEIFALAKILAGKLADGDVSLSPFSVVGHLAGDGAFQIAKEVFGDPTVVAENKAFWSYLSKELRELEKVIRSGDQSSAELAKLSDIGTAIGGGLSLFVSGDGKRRNKSVPFPIHLMDELFDFAAKSNNAKLRGTVLDKSAALVAAYCGSDQDDSVRADCIGAVWVSLSRELGSADESDRLLEGFVDAMRLRLTAYSGERWIVDESTLELFRAAFLEPAKAGESPIAPLKSGLAISEGLLAKAVAVFEKCDRGFEKTRQVFGLAHRLNDLLDAAKKDANCIWYNEQHHVSCLLSCVENWCRDGCGDGNAAAKLEDIFAYFTGRTYDCAQEIRRRTADLMEFLGYSPPAAAVEKADADSWLVPSYRAYLEVRDAIAAESVKGPPPVTRGEVIAAVGELVFGVVDGWRCNKESGHGGRMKYFAYFVFDKLPHLLLPFGEPAAADTEDLAKLAISFGDKTKHHHNANAELSRAALAAVKFSEMSTARSSLVAALEGKEDDLKKVFAAYESAVFVDGNVNQTCEEILLSDFCGFGHNDYEVLRAVVRQNKTPNALLDALKLPQWNGKTGSTFKSVIVEQLISICELRPIEDLFIKAAGDEAVTELAKLSYAGAATSGGLSLFVSEDGKWRNKSVPFPIDLVGELFDFAAISKDAKLRETALDKSAALVVAYCGSGRAPAVRTNCAVAVWASLLRERGSEDESDRLLEGFVDAMRLRLTVRSGEEWNVDESTFELFRNAFLEPAEAGKNPIAPSKPGLVISERLQAKVVDALKKCDSDLGKTRKVINSADQLIGSLRGELENNLRDAFGEADYNLRFWHRKHVRCIMSCVENWYRDGCGDGSAAAELADILEWSISGMFTLGQEAICGIVDLVELLGYSPPTAAVEEFDGDYARSKEFAMAYGAYLEVRDAIANVRHREPPGTRGDAIAAVGELVFNAVDGWRRFASVGRGRETIRRYFLSFVFSGLPNLLLPLGGRVGADELVKLAISFGDSTEHPNNANVELSMDAISVVRFSEMKAARSSLFAALEGKENDYESVFEVYKSAVFVDGNVNQTCEEILLSLHCGFGKHGHGKIHCAALENENLDALLEALKFPPWKGGTGSTFKSVIVEPLISICELRPIEDLFIKAAGGKAMTELAELSRPGMAIDDGLCLFVSEDGKWRNKSVPFPIHLVDELFDFAATSKDAKLRETALDKSAALVVAYCGSDQDDSAVRASCAGVVWASLLRERGGSEDESDRLLEGFVDAMRLRLTVRSGEGWNVDESTFELFRNAFPEPAEAGKSPIAPSKPGLVISERLRAKAVDALKKCDSDFKKTGQVFGLAHGLNDLLDVAEKDADYIWHNEHVSCLLSCVENWCRDGCGDGNAAAGLEDIFAHFAGRTYDGATEIRRHTADLMELLGYCPRDAAVEKFDGDYASSEELTAAYGAYLEVIAAVSGKKPPVTTRGEVIAAVGELVFNAADGWRSSAPVERGSETIQRRFSSFVFSKLPNLLLPFGKPAAADADDLAKLAISFGDSTDHPHNANVELSMGAIGVVRFSEMQAAKKHLFAAIEGKEKDYKKVLEAYKTAVFVDGKVNQICEEFFLSDFCGFRGNNHELRAAALQNKTPDALLEAFGSTQWSAETGSIFKRAIAEPLISICALHHVDDMFIKAVGDKAVTELAELSHAGVAISGGLCLFVSEDGKWRNESVPFPIDLVGELFDFAATSKDAKLCETALDKSAALVVAYCGSDQDDSVRTNCAVAVWASLLRERESEDESDRLLEGFVDAMRLRLTVRSGEKWNVDESAFELFQNALLDPAKAGKTPIVPSKPGLAISERLRAKAVGALEKCDSDLEKTRKVINLADQLIGSLRGELGNDLRNASGGADCNLESWHRKHVRCIMSCIENLCRDGYGDGSAAAGLKDIFAHFTDRTSDGAQEIRCHTAGLMELLGYSPPAAAVEKSDGDYARNKELAIAYGAYLGVIAAVSGKKPPTTTRVEVIAAVGGLVSDVTDGWKSSLDKFRGGVDYSSCLSRLNVREGYFAHLVFGKLPHLLLPFGEPAAADADDLAKLAISFGDSTKHHHNANVALSRAALAAAKFSEMSTARSSLFAALEGKEADFKKVFAAYESAVFVDGKVNQTCEEILLSSFCGFKGYGCGKIHDAALQNENPDELLAALKFPPWKGGTGSTFKSVIVEPLISICELHSIVALLRKAAYGEAVDVTAAKEEILKFVLVDGEKVDSGNLRLLSSVVDNLLGEMASKAPTVSREYNKLMELLRFPSVTHGEKSYLLMIGAIRYAANYDKLNAAKRLIAEGITNGVGLGDQNVRDKLLAAVCVNGKIDEFLADHLCRWLRLSPESSLDLRVSALAEVEMPSEVAKDTSAASINAAMDVLCDVLKSSAGGSAGDAAVADVVRCLEFDIEVASNRKKVDDAIDAIGKFLGDKSAVADATEIGEICEAISAAIVDGEGNVCYGCVDQIRNKLANCGPRSEENVKALCEALSGKFGSLFDFDLLPHTADGIRAIVTVKSMLDDDMADASMRDAALAACARALRSGGYYYSGASPRCMGFLGEICALLKGCMAAENLSMGRIGEVCRFITDIWHLRGELAAHDCRYYDFGLGFGKIAGVRRTAIDRIVALAVVDSSASESGAAAVCNELVAMCRSSGIECIENIFCEISSMLELLCLGKVDVNDLQGALLRLSAVADAVDKCALGERELKVRDYFRYSLRYSLRELNSKRI
jgi:hypothetical protein